MLVRELARPARIADNPSECAAEWRWARLGVRVAILGNEKGGIPIDRSPFRHELALAGTATWEHDDHTGRSVKPSATGGLRIIPDAGGGTMPGMTMVFFAKLVNAGNQYYGDGRSSTGTYCLLGFTDSQVVNYGGSNVYSKSVIPKAGESYVTIIRNDGANSDAFVDGDKGTTVAATATNRRSLGTNYRIGNRYTDGSPWLDNIHGFWVYDRALSDDECIALSRDPWGPWRKKRAVFGRVPVASGSFQSAWASGANAVIQGVG